MQINTYFTSLFFITTRYNLAVKKVIIQGTKVTITTIHTHNQQGIYSSFRWQSAQMKYRKTILFYFKFISHITILPPTQFKRPLVNRCLSLHLVPSFKHRAHICYLVTSLTTSKSPSYPRWTMDSRCNNFKLLPRKYRHSTNERNEICYDKATFHRK